MVEHDIAVPSIAIVRSPRGWARTLHRYVVDHGGAIVRTRPLEERQALEDEYDILLADDISSFLTSHIVEELHRRGRRVLGVFDPDDYSGGDEHAGKKRLMRLGVDAVIEAGSSPEEFVRVIEEFAPIPSERVSHFDDLSTAFSTLNSDELHRAVPDESGADGPAIAPQSSQRRRGNITAVLGASGGCGVTEIAIELARSLGKRGERTVLVDGDELSPSMAQRLNLSLHPNIRTAVDVVEHSTGRLSECLTAIASGLEVLVGIPHPKDWVELRGSDMASVLEELARGRPQIVANASPLIEDLASFGVADRFAISRAVVNRADVIVLVCPPSPMGVARLIDRAADLAELAGNKPLHVVVNRTQKGTFKRNEIAREIQRSFSPAGIHFLPMDQRVEKAAWEGTLVPAGEFTKVLATSLTPAIPKATIVSASRARRPAEGGHLRTARKGA